MAEIQLYHHEAGRRGKPDRLDADIAHLIGAVLLKQDPQARFDLRVHGGVENKVPEEPSSGDLVVRIGGEISSHLLTNASRSRVAEVTKQHYDSIQRSTSSLSVDTSAFKPQEVTLATNGKAGDSGVGTAVAFIDTPNYLPWERFLAVDIKDLIDDIYQDSGRVPSNLATISGVDHIEGIRADGKVGVDVAYCDGYKVLTDIVVAVNHEENTNIELELTNVIKAYLGIIANRHPSAILTSPNITINGYGPWTNEAGWTVDAGDREAKPQNDYFGAWGNVADAPFGEDPSKPEGPASMLARYIAVNVVGIKLASFAKVILSYKIGEDQPRLNIYTAGTSTVPQKELELAMKSALGNLSIKATAERFSLRSPELYRQVALESDMFHNPNLPWNQVHPGLYAGR